MKKLGFDIEEYRAAAQQRQERTEEMDLKREANTIATNNAKTARNAFWVSIGASGISLAALFVALFK